MSGPDFHWVTKALLIAILLWIVAVTAAITYAVLSWGAAS